MRVGWVSSLLTAGCVLGALTAVLVAHPETPLPKAWNPAEPFRVTDDLTPLTPWKLRIALRSGPACLTALASERVASRPAFVDDTLPGCGISAPVEIRALGDAAFTPVETSCAVALRLAMWERHALQPSAAQILGADVTEILHFQSYSCRPIRTMAGPSGRLSTHATGDAIDVSGFRLSDGRTLRLTADWDGDGPEAMFLRAARDGACRWFGTTLGPDYNALHADHFHLQARGRGLCR